MAAGEFGLGRGCEEEVLGFDVAVDEVALAEELEGAGCVCSWVSGWTE